MSKRKPEDDRRPGCLVKFFTGLYPNKDNNRRGIILQKNKWQIPELPGSRHKKPRFRPQWIVVFENGEVRECTRHELEFQGQASVVELLTFNNHPDLIKMALRRKTNEERLFKKMTKQSSNHIVG
jgi:hypothetical protein